MEQSLTSIAIINEANKRRSTDSNDKSLNNNNNNNNNNSAICSKSPVAWSTGLCNCCVDFSGCKLNFTLFSLFFFH
ncbi:MAG: hypothetical protein N7Q72_01840, partial [Spiroplasma sp. Tabriz.8]|nr:hypothetical protein [Candidatus Regiella insecticola]MCZ8631985.1 hypothetical protein [Spiroplasma sp. Tabriz.8]